MLMAALSWRFIERPFRNRKFLPSYRRVAAFGVTVILVTMSLGLFSRNDDYFDSRMSDQMRRWQLTSKMDERFSLESPTRLDDFPGGLIRIGTEGAKVETLMWGDSHALALLPGLEHYCNKVGAAAEVAWHNNTVPCADFVFSYDKSRKDNPEELNKAMMDLITNDRYKNVVLVARWANYFGSDRLEGAFLKTVDAIIDRGVRVCFVVQVPDYGYDVPKHLVKYSVSGQNIAELGYSLNGDEYLNLNEERMIFQLIAKGVTVLNLISELPQRNSTVLPFDNEGCYYYDSNHLSKYGAIRVSAGLAPIFSTLKNPRGQGQ